MKIKEVFKIMKDKYIHKKNKRKKYAKLPSGIRFQDILDEEMKKYNK